MKTTEQQIIAKYKELVELFDIYQKPFMVSPKFKCRDLVADIAKLEAQLKEQEEECCHPWASVLGGGETQPSKCLKCGKIL